MVRRFGGVLWSSCGIGSLCICLMPFTALRWALSVTCGSGVRSDGTSAGSSGVSKSKSGRSSQSSLSRSSYSFFGIGALLISSRQAAEWDLRDFRKREIYCFRAN